MEVKLRGNYHEGTNPLHFILGNRGIKEEDFSKYIKPSKELMPDWKQLDNIEDGFKLLKEHINSSCQIGILVDPDMDGLSSASIMYKFLVKQLEVPKSRIIMIPPQNKMHGIAVNRVLDYKLSKGDLLITPDAASSDFEQHTELKNIGIDTLVIDHHLSKKQFTPAVIINNQLAKDFPNKALTGSSMVYLFCLGYCEYFARELTVQLQDLSAMGLVADRADFSQDVGAYYLMREGLKKEHIDSLMLKKIIEKNSNLEKGSDLNAKDIGFNVAPVINSVFRIGTEEELTQVIHGMCEFDYMTHNKRKKMDIHISEEAYLRAMAVKRRQKKQEDEVIEKIKKRIKEKGSDKYKILIVNSTGIVEQNGLNGLVAMKLAREFGKPVLMVKRVGDKMMGSARNINNSPIEDLNKLLTNTGKFVCKGHANAFGVEFDIEDALDILNIIEAELVNVDFDSVEYEVDFKWENYLDVEVIHNLGLNKDMWCNGIDEPLIFLKNIVVRKENMKLIGKTGNTLKLQIQGVDCVKFFLKEEEKHEIATAPDLMYLDIICTASVNSFRGMNTPQLLIEDYNIKDAKEHIKNNLCEDDLPF
ncbi:DHH family phosphoesterase [Staphylococcus xylosus]|uniref:DHH family phosphoesterase n=1 Tax=Staphylococcus xylosus TaxID=1288 RepID=UPI000D1D1E7F|nr:DHH family phosphoesterase [Staphylococcus xylosus]PTH96989.1 single-stranded DNA-binding protein [Staphylococcus xylosus]